MPTQSPKEKLKLLEIIFANPAQPWQHRGPYSTSWTDFDNKSDPFYFAGGEVTIRLFPGTHWMAPPEDYRLVDADADRPLWGKPLPPNSLYWSTSRRRWVEYTDPLAPAAIFQYGESIAVPLDWSPDTEDAAPVRKWAATTEEKLARAERALLRGGYEDLGGQEWKPPLGKPPVWIPVNELPWKPVDQPPEDEAAFVYLLLIEHGRADVICQAFNRRSTLRTHWMHLVELPLPAEYRAKEPVADPLRERFETWALDPPSEGGGGFEGIERDPDNRDEYHLPALQLSWKVWQAACKKKEGAQS